MTAVISRVADYKLFIPGPVPVADEVLAAMAGQVYGHRGARYEEVHARLRPLLQALFATRGTAFGLTCPATGVMELLARQSVRPGRRVINLVNGAFAQRWHEIACACGVSATALSRDWGQVLDLAALEKELAVGDVDAVTVTYSETSTGMLNPLHDIAKIVGHHDDTVLLVDAVSALAGAPLDFDAWGVDAAFAGVQKVLACPPGFTVLALSERMVQRATEVPHRGWAWDIVAWAKQDAKNSPLATPSLSHMAALTKRLEFLLEQEGLDGTLNHHAALAARAQAWACEHFALYPHPGTLTPTLTTVEVPSDFDPVGFIKRVKESSGFILGGGYGKLKPSTFRIAHMGECRREDLEELLEAMERVL